MMHPGPDKLLLKHKYLLGLDVGYLGEGAMIYRQYWIANIESVILASPQVYISTVVNRSMPWCMRLKRSNATSRRGTGSVIHRRPRRRPQEMRVDKASVAWENKRMSEKCNVPVKYGRPLLMQTHGKESQHKKMTQSFICCCSVELTEKKEK